jgi:hypothetical protein
MNLRFTEECDEVTPSYNETTVFFTNAYLQSDNCEKQYPMLKFVWNNSENILTAVGTKYEESYNGNSTLTEKGQKVENARIIVK